MTKPDFAKIYPDFIMQQVCEGYYDGRRPDSPEPGTNRHPAYIHGFRNGRDDYRCSARLQKWPSRTAQESREALAYIEATEATT